MNLNKAMIIGNLTRDPEVRSTPSGQTVASFAVATNLVWTDQSGQKQEKVEFHNVVVWGKLAELCSQYLTKGSKVHIMGRLQTRSWEGTDGAKKQRTEIIASDVVFVSTRGGQGGPREESFGDSLESPKPAKKPKKNEEQKETENNEEEISIDDIPF